MLACIASSAVGHGLAPLPEIGSTDAHWVADDWAGSGNWVDRVNAYALVPAGTPVKATTTQFAGRSDIAFGNGPRFLSAANAAHSLHGDITIEAIVFMPTTPASSLNAIYDAGTSGTVGSINLFAFYTGGVLYTEVDAGKTPSGYLTAANANCDGWRGHYALITYVIDTLAGFAYFYLNGSLVTSAALSGAPASASIAVSVGADVAGSGSRAVDAKIVEIVRHQVAMSAGTITARAVQFNALKGY